MEKLLALPTPLLAALGVLLVVQLSLQVYTLVDVARRARVSALPKWGWVLVIVLGEILGPILYLALGRSVPEAAADPLAQKSSGDDLGRAEKAADLLYGDRR
jgi:hypothetical protein